MAIFANPDRMAFGDDVPTRNINLTDHLDRFIETEVGSGRYGNASEVVREGLRLMERRKQEEQAKLKWLRGAVRNALDEVERGESLEFASMDALGSAVDQIGIEAATAVHRKRKSA